MLTLRNALSPSLLPVLAVLLSGLAGCGEGAAVSDIPSGATAELEFQPDIPTPSHITKSISAVRKGDFQFGGEYEPGLAYANVSAPGAGPATFSPDYPQGSNGTEGAAYAVYAFQLTELLTDANAYLYWGSPAPDYANLWLGLGNFRSDSWEWYAASPDGVLPFLPSTHLQSDQILLAVMCLGSTAAHLDYIKIGNEGKLNPLAKLVADQAKALPGATVNLDASGSIDPDGTIADYEWDLDGNGTFNDAPDEVAAHGNSVATTAYVDVGFYMPQVRVTDDEGLVSGASIQVEVTRRGDWWMFGRDAQHNRRSPYVGPQTSNLKWSFSTGAAIKSSPAIALDGTIYVGSDDKKLWAITDDGAAGVEKWAFTTLNAVYSSPAIAQDGTIYVGGHDWLLYAFSDDGSAGVGKWGANTGGAIYSSPTIGPDGTIYVGTDGNALYAYTDNGDTFTEKWAFGPVFYLESCPAIGPTGAIYFGGYNNMFYSLTDNGTSGDQNWSFEAGGIYASAAIGADGTVYMASEDKKLYAFTDNGGSYTEKWSVTLPDVLRASPAIGADGTIYQGCWNGRLYAIADNTISGTEKWSFATGGALVSSPAIGGDGVVYFGSTDAKFYAITDGVTSASELWSYQTGGQIWSSPAIGENGTLYVGCHDGKLYAFGASPEGF